MTPLFAIKINIPFLCLSRRVLHHFVSQMSHCASLLEPIEKLWKEGSGTGYVQPFEIQSLSSFVFSEVKWGEQWKMRVSQERHPPDHCTKRPTMIISVWQHIICAYCAVVLLTLHLSQNTYHLDSASQLYGVWKKCRWNTFPLKLSSFWGLPFVLTNAILSFVFIYCLIHFGAYETLFPIMLASPSCPSVALGKTAVSTESSPPKPKWHHWPFVSVKYLRLGLPYGNICLMGPRCQIPMPSKNKKNLSFSWLWRMTCAATALSSAAHLHVHALTQTDRSVILAVPYAAQLSNQPMCTS